MIGFDASSTELYSGIVELRVNLAVGSNADAVTLAQSRLEDFLKAVKVGYFFPGNLSNPSLIDVHPNGTLIYSVFEVIDLATTAFAVFGGMLTDCRHHEVSFQTAHAILGSDILNLLIETGIRPASADNPPFLVELPTDQSGNYALLVEIEFANLVPVDIGQELLDELALWEILSLAYPIDPDEPAEVGGAQRLFNDQRTIHHHEWVWDNADYSAWNLLVNLCCSWSLRLPIVRLHVE
jgi:hypothetical protein